MTNEQQEPKSLATKLAQIHQNVLALNAKTDELNATILAMESGLENAGVPFWWNNGPKLCLEQFMDERNIPARTFYLLGYVKLNGRWSIAVREYEGSLETALNEHDWDDIEASTVPLRQAPRYVRVAAASHLRPFLEALNEAICSMADEIESVNAELRS